MFQVFPSMKMQLSQMQSPIEPILPDPKPHPLADHIETIVQSFFDADISKEKVKASHLLVDNEILEKKEFFELATRPLLKILKREQKKMEQLVQFHTRPSGQQQLNRIKLDKILKECFLKIQNSSRQVYAFIQYMQRNSSWECNCKNRVCEQRQSLDQFWIDIFGFFYRSSKIINQQIHYALERGVQLHYFYSSVNDPTKGDWKLGYKLSELLLLIEKNCELSKAKKKKRNKKQKEKNGPLEVQQKTQQVDQDERILNSFIQSLNSVKQEKEPCLVTEEWLAKIANKKNSFKI